MLLIQGELREYAVSQLIQHVVYGCLHVASTSFGIELDLLGYLFFVFLLVCREIFKVCTLHGGLLNVNEPHLLHLHAICAVDQQPWAEYVIEHEKLLLEHPARLCALVGYNVLPPHPKELPPLELLEEAQLLNVVVRVPLNQPVPQSDELNWALLHIEGDAFGTQGVVALLVPIVVLADIEVVGVSCV